MAFVNDRTDAHEYCYGYYYAYDDQLESDAHDAVSSSVFFAFSPAFFFAALMALLSAAGVRSAENLSNGRRMAHPEA